MITGFNDVKEVLDDILDVIEFVKECEEKYKKSKHNLLEEYLQWNVLPETTLVTEMESGDNNQLSGEGLSGLDDQPPRLNVAKLTGIYPVLTAGKYIAGDDTQRRPKLRRICKYRIQQRKFEFIDVPYEM